MKKSLIFALSLMLLSLAVTGCSMGEDEVTAVTPTEAPTVTLEATAAPTVESDEGNVTDDAITDEANDAASDSLTDDMTNSTTETPAE